jgi:hypothetical protein
LPLLLDIALKLTLTHMQNTNLLIVSFLLNSLLFLLLHLLAEGARRVLVLGLCFWVCEPEFIGYTVCFFLGPFFSCARFVYRVFLSQPF